MQSSDWIIINKETRHLFKCCSNAFKVSLTNTYPVVEEIKYNAQKKYIKKSNKICHREMTYSNRTTENKNINRSKHCSVITVDLEQVLSSV